MAVQVGSAFGKIGLGVGDFTAGVGIVLTSLDVLESRFKTTGQTLETAFGTPLKGLPGNLNEAAQAGISVGNSFEKAAAPIREFGTSTTNLENKILSLTERIALQKRQLEILDAELLKTITSDKASQQQIERKILAFDRLSASIRSSERTLNAYQEESQEGAKATNLFARALDQLENAGKRAGSSISSAGGSMKRALEFAAGNLISEGIQAVAQGIRDVGVAMIQGNQDFQVYEGQFSVLLGSVEEAKARLEELEEFGRTTPFELPEVVKASRQLEVLTKGALSTGEGLRFVGDVAAGVNEPLEDVSMWIGRAYDAMQAGRPFGEAAMRLQEMGALSGEARNRLEELQKQGADSSTVWKVFTEDLARFDGQMEVLSGTFQAVKSNLADTFDKTVRIIGQDSFAALEAAAKRALEAIDANQGDIIKFAEELGAGLGDATEAGIQLLEQVDWKLLGEFISSAAEKAGDLAEFLADVVDFMGQVGEASTAGHAADQLFTLSEAYYAAIKSFQEQGKTTIAAGLAMDLLTGNLESADRMIRLNAEATAAFNQELIKTGQATGEIPLDQFNEQLAAATETVEAAAPPLITLEQRLTALYERTKEIASAKNPLEAIFAPETIGRFADQLEQRADATEKYGEKTREIAGRIAEGERDYRDEVNANLQQLTEARNDYNEAVAEKARETAETLKALDKDYLETLKGQYQERKALDEEYTDSRQELQEKANQELQENEDTFTQESRAIQAERQEAEAELQKSILEADKEFSEERTELEREYGEAVKDITSDLDRVHTDYTRERGYRHKDHTDNLTDLEVGHAEKVKKINDDILDSAKRLADKRRDVGKNLKEDLDDLEKDHADTVEEIQEEIDELRSKSGTIGVGSMSGLTGDDRKRLQKLIDQLAEENQAYKDQAEKLAKDAEEEIAEEQERHDQALADLTARLEKEEDAYNDAVEQENERFRRQEEAKDLAYNRAVEQLEDRLSKESAAHDRQLADIIAKHQAEVDDANLANQKILESLNVRFTAALALRDTHRQAIQEKLTEELADIDNTYAQALDKLKERFTKELETYESKRADLRTKHAEELEDLRVSYEERVATVGEKLDEIKEKHRESQQDLRDQIKETKDAYHEELQAIADEFTKPADAITRIEESLTRIREQTSQPFNLQFNVTGLPEEHIPRSPSKFEQSLERVIKLMGTVSQTPMVFDVQQAGGRSGTATGAASRAGAAPTLDMSKGPLVHIENLNIGDLDSLKGLPKEIGRMVEEQLEVQLNDIIERSYLVEAGGWTETPGRRTT